MDFDMFTQLKSVFKSSIVNSQILQRMISDFRMILTLITVLRRSVLWKNLDRGGEYRPNTVGHDSPIQTDLSRIIRCLLHGKQEKNQFVL